MSITKQQKEEILSELKQKFGDAKSIAFGQYSGMSVDQVSDLRRKMREADVEFKVAKKTLLKLAAKEHGVELPDDVMEGTVGAIISYADAVSGPKIVKDASKKIEVLKLLGGMMDGRVLSVNEMKELADLPSREQLLAKFMMMMRAPLQSFHGVMSSPLGSAARAFKAYAEQMPQEAAAAPEAPVAEEAPKMEEAPAPEAPAEEVVADAPEAPAEEAPAEGDSE